jgi:putative flippase GtrA
MKVIKEVIAFGLVGALGFLIDAGVLYVLKSSLGLYLSRAISFFCAVIVTWLLNRSLTFKGEKRERKLVLEFIHYMVLMLIGGAFNVGVYYLMVHQSELVKVYPVIGVAAGSIVGMLVNFSTSRIMFYSTKPR